MTTPPIDTNWIQDIDPDPRFVRKMAELVSDAIDDQLSDYVFGIITDYVPNSGDLTENEEDWVMDNIHSPLYDRILRAILDNLIGDDSE